MGLRNLPLEFAVNSQTQEVPSKRERIEVSKYGFAVFLLGKPKFVVNSWPSEVPSKRERIEVSKYGFAVISLGKPKFVVNSQPSEVPSKIEREKVLAAFARVTSGKYAVDSHALIVRWSDTLEAHDEGLSIRRTCVQFSVGACLGLTEVTVRRIDRRKRLGPKGTGRRQ
jgi:hypothetical protein